MKFYDVKRMQGFLLAILLLVMMGMLTGCPAIQGSHPQTQMLAIYDQYNAQFHDYMSAVGYEKKDGKWIQTSEPVLSEKRKEILRKKKKVLDEADILIGTYEDLIDKNKPIPADLTTKIFEVLNKYTYD